MQNDNVTRRQVLTTTAIGPGTLAMSPLGHSADSNGSAGLPAILGGKPVRTAPFPRWPIFREADEKAVLPVLRSGVWSRAKVVAEAEKRFAQLMGAKYCLATSSGTNAIITAIRGLDIGAEDEVITTPYTFAATVLPILLANALPIFADIDAETWQIAPPRSKLRSTKTRSPSCRFT
jgi:perosamine synthetase